MGGQQSNSLLWWVSELAEDNILTGGLKGQGWEVRVLNTEIGFTIERLVLNKEGGQRPVAVLVGNLPYMKWKSIIVLCAESGLDRFVAFSSDSMVNDLIKRYVDENRLDNLPHDFTVNLLDLQTSDPQNLLKERPDVFSSRLELALAPFRGQEAPGRGGGVERFTP